MSTRPMSTATKKTPPEITSLPARQAVRQEYRREADARGLKMIAFTEYLICLLKVATPELREEALRRLHERMSKIAGGGKAA